MMEKGVTARELVENICAKSSKEEKERCVGILQESIRCHRESIALESKAKALIGELADMTVVRHGGNEDSSRSFEMTASNSDHMRKTDNGKTAYGRVANSSEEEM